MRVLPRAVIYGAVNWPWPSVSRKVLTSASPSRHDQLLAERRRYARKRRARHAPHLWRLERHRPDLNRRFWHGWSPSWRGACGAPTLGGSRVGDEALPGAGRGAAGDLAQLATPRYLVAASQRSHADNAANLHQLGCITRLPNTLTVVSQVVTQALNGTRGSVSMPRPAITAASCVTTGWPARAGGVVAGGPGAAEATVSHAGQREAEALKTPLLHVQAQRFETPRAPKQRWRRWRT